MPLLVACTALNRPIVDATTLPAYVHCYLSGKQERDTYAESANRVAIRQRRSDRRPAYRVEEAPRAYFDRIAVGQQLPDMPIFLTPFHYVNVPLEQTYMESYRGAPERWKQVIEGPDHQS